MQIIVKGSGKHSSGWSNARLVKQFGHREEHEYNHFNRALGKQIYSKEHFIKELEAGGYVGESEGDLLVEQAKSNNHKPYDGISKKTEKAIRDLKASADKHGNLSSLEGTKRCLEELGLDFGLCSKMPVDTPTTGGIRSDEGMKGK